MRLESALYTSREGLNAHGQAIGVIGDNISNVSTIGYKASRSEFEDLVSEGAGRESYAVTGGGSGVAVSRIRQIHETGVIEFSGRTLDVAIAGRGFFMVGTPDNPSYTRAGNFEISEEGLLVDAQGQPVLGSVGTAEAGTLSSLNLLDIDVSGTATSLATLTANLNASDAISAPPEAPATFREVAAAASFAGSLTVYDSLGSEHAVNLSFFKTENNTWTAQAYIDGSEVGQEAGVPVLLGETSLVFGDDGLLPEGTAANIAATAAYSNGAAAGNFTIDLSNFTQYATASQLSGIVQDGQGTGEITGYEFRKDGRLVAVLSNGNQINVGTIQLADFTNLDGLQRAGNNLFVQAQGAGAKEPGTPGTNGLGELEGSSLERSTVDLANQFVDLTLYQRGYQANSQIMNVTNDMLRDTLSLIR